MIPAPAQKKRQDWRVLPLLFCRSPAAAAAGETAGWPYFGAARKPLPPWCCRALRRSVLSVGAAVVLPLSSLPSASKRFSTSAICATLVDLVALRAPLRSSFGAAPPAAAVLPSKAAIACTRPETLPRIPVAVVAGAGVLAAGVAAAPCCSQTSPAAWVAPSAVW